MKDLKTGGEQMKETKVTLLGLYLKQEYLEDKELFVKDVETTIREYMKRNGKKPVQMSMNYATSAKVQEIMKIADGELVGVCGLEPAYSAVMRDDYVFVSDGSL